MSLGQLHLQYILNAHLGVIDYSTAVANPFAPRQVLLGRLPSFATILVVFMPAKNSLSLETSEHTETGYTGYTLKARDPPILKLSSNLQYQIKLLMEMQILCMTSFLQ